MGAVSIIVLNIAEIISALTDTQNTQMFLLIFNMMFMFYAANMLLGLFNLLPVPPLDGYKVFGAALPRDLYFRVMRYERYIGMVFLLLIFFGGGILGRILTVLRVPFDLVIATPINWLFNLLRDAIGLNSSIISMFF